ncbi:MAG TPA: glycosyl transferase, partial [Candidatus Dormibacteraeota bacterium]
MAIFGHRAATPLGQLLLRRGVITQESLDEALDLQRHEKLPLGETLLAGGAHQRDVWSGLAAQWGLRITNL